MFSCKDIMSGTDLCLRALLCGRKSFNPIPGLI